MDVLNSYGLAVGITFGVLSGVFTFFNRQRYQTLVTIYQQGNDELRKQIESVKAEKTDLEKDCAETNAKYVEQTKYVSKLEELNLRPSAFADLSRTISNNHKAMMTELTKLASVIAKDKR
jgi:phage protein D